MLKNLTLISLSQKNLSPSPLFTHSSTIQKNEFKISNSMFSKSSSNILYSNSNFGKLSIKNTKISNSLIAPIYVEQISNENIVLNKHSRNSFTNNLRLIVMRTVFSKCFSPKRGGALYVQHDFCTFILMNSAFQECTSTFTNGAVFYRGRSSVLRQNCFEKCLGRQSGSFSAQAFFLSTRNDFKNEFNESSITQSSPYVTRGRDNPGTFWKGNAIIQNINSSINHILGKTCGLLLSNIDKSSIAYNTFFNSSGSSIINMQMFRGGNDLSFFNLVENDVSDRGAIFFIYDTNAIVCNAAFIKNNGKFLTAAGNWKFQLDSCIADVPLDKALPKMNNVQNYRCVFGTSDIKTHKIVSVQDLFCWNDCGDNEKCVMNIVGYKKPDIQELLHHH